MVVVLLAGFLDLLLPDNQLKGVARLIMGLLILTIFIQPLTLIFQIPVEPAWSLSEMSSQPLVVDTGNLMEQGLNLRRRWEEVYAKDSQAELAQEIEIILARHKIGKLVDLNLERNDGRLRAVRIRVSPRAAVNIRPERRQAISNEIIRQVNQLTGLNEKQIEVIWNEF